MGLYKCFLPCIVLLLVVTGAEAAQVVNGALGGSVTFNVFFTFQPYTIIWNTGNAIDGTIPVANLPPSGIIQYFGQYVGRCELYRNGSLRLDNVTYTDQGVYTVTAQSADFSQSDTQQLQLNIYTPLTDPVLRVNASDGLIAGRNVTLHCDAGNQTVTDYTFYQGQKDICSVPHVTCRGSFLYFQPITGSDTGTYTCTIKNPVSTRTSNPVYMFIIVPVSEVTLTSNTSHNTSMVWPGIDSVSLHCSSRGTNVSFSWSLKGAALHQDPRYHLTENNSTLIISPVSANDNGTFTCTASNSISNGTSNGVTLNLASPVSAVTLSSDNTSGLLWVGEDSVSLYCSAQGSAVNFSWSLNGELLSQHPPYYITQESSPPTSNLTISPVSRNDNGPFTCTGSNLANSESSDVLSLDLAWHPEGNIRCLPHTYDQTLQLTCSWPGGQPAANVTMILDNKTETNHNQVSRNLTSENNVQGSNLSCHGDQQGRTSSCILPLEPPQSSGHDNSTITTVTVGQTAVMTVYLIAGLHYRANAPTPTVLPAKFSWLFPNGSLISNGNKFTVISTDYTSSLHISDVTNEEGGRYRCTAVNFIGNATFNFTLDVTATATGGLNGGEIAGIVIGVLAGVAIIGIIVFFIVKKYVPQKPVNENTDNPSGHFYENILKAPKTERTISTNQNPHYETVIPTDGNTYSNVINVPSKQK